VRRFLIGNAQVPRRDVEPLISMLVGREGRTESFAISGLHAGTMVWVVANAVYMAGV